MILRLVACSHNAESVSGSAKSEALAVSLESREKLFREELCPLRLCGSFPRKLLTTETQRDAENQLASDFWGKAVII